MDDFENFQAGLTTPAEAAHTVVPNDTTDLPHASRALYVGISGDVALQLVSGDTVVLRNVQGGVIYPLRVSRVLALGTTAGELVALR